MSWKLNGIFNNPWQKLSTKNCESVLHYWPYHYPAFQLHVSVISCEGLVCKGEIKHQRAPSLLLEQNRLLVKLSCTGVHYGMLYFSLLMKTYEILLFVRQSLQDQSQGSSCTTSWDSESPFVHQLCRDICTLFKGKSFLGLSFLILLNIFKYITVVLSLRYHCSYLEVGMPLNSEWDEWQALCITAEWVMRRKWNDIRQVFPWSHSYLDAHHCSFMHLTNHPSAFLNKMVVRSVNIISANNFLPSITFLSIKHLMLFLCHVLN